MKKIIIDLILLTFFSLTVCSQNMYKYVPLAELQEEKVFVNKLYFDFTYDYNSVDRSSFISDIKYKGALTKWLDVWAGVRISTANDYALLGRLDFMWSVRDCGRLGLRNQYTYNLYSSYNVQSFNGAVMAVYEHDYFYVGIGAFSQFFTAIKSKIDKRYIIEPIDIAYDIEGRVFPVSHFWNVGLQITNVRPFVTEHSYNPNFIIKGYYNVYKSDFENINLMIRMGLQQSGVFSVAAHHYECYLTVGVECAI